MRTLLQDLRYSLRQLFQNPGFSLTALISLALGIGAATAVFSVLYSGLLHPFPYRAAENLVADRSFTIPKAADPVSARTVAADSSARTTSIRRNGARDRLPLDEPDGTRTARKCLGTRH